MSSTNRSNARDSHISDYYITPQYAIRNFLDEFIHNEGINISSQNQLILDPCAGGDLENDMSYPAVLFEYGADYNKIITYDIRYDSPAKIHGDFLQTDIENKYDIVITNPPFAIAQDIIEKSLVACKEGGYVIMLLRLNYVGSKKTRQKFREDNIPSSIYIHNKRISFVDGGQTDSIEYAHFVRKKGDNPSYTKTYILKEHK